MLSKPQLYQACLAQLEEKIDLLNEAIKDAQETIFEDTKSSAGDKFETTREMMKLEIDKNALQLSGVVKMHQALKQLHPKMQMDQVAFGSLVTTNEGIYFFSVSLGKIAVEGQAFFAISMASPIGKALAGKKAGESVSFMGREIRIEEIR